MNKELPIGIFDSGLGGFGVYKALQKELPREDFIYFADNNRIPYGNLSPETIHQYTADVIHFLEKQGVKLIVLACHTASAHWLKNKTKVPVIGMIESAMASLEQCEDIGRLAVFGTPSTMASRVYPYEIECRFDNLSSEFISCSQLALMIESGWLQPQELEMLIKRDLECTASLSFDTALLACTHYPLILKSFQKVLGESVQFIDPAGTVAKQVRNLLEKEFFLNPSGGLRHQFFVTETPEIFSNKVERFFNMKITPTLCKV